MKPAPWDLSYRPSNIQLWCWRYQLEFMMRALGLCWVLPYVCCGMGLAWKWLLLGCACMAQSVMGPLSGRYSVGMLCIWIMSLTVAALMAVLCQGCSSCTQADKLLGTKCALSDKSEQHWGGGLARARMMLAKALARERCSQSAGMWNQCSGCTRPHGQ